MSAPLEKQKIVVKRKARNLIHPKLPKKRGLPTVRNNGAATIRTTTPPSDDDDSDEDVSFLSNVNETLLVLQSLQQHSPEQCLAIPIASGIAILSVPECTLQRMLNSEGRGDTDRDILLLLQRNQIKKLFSDQLETCVFTSDYIRGVQQAQQDQHGNETVVDWFLSTLSEWTTDHFSEQDVDARASNKAPMRASDLLAELCRIQVVRRANTIRHHHPQQHGLYQLWLPSFGTVIKAWNEASTRLLAKLKRSLYKERTVEALQQPYSPIASSLVLDQLVAHGKVRMVERPAGTFVQLVE